VETGRIERTETEEFVGVMEDLRKPVRIAVQKLLDIQGIEVDRGTFINVTSDPEGVNIYIDGLFEGSAPARIKVPGPGEYRVKLYSPGYEEWHQKVTVEESSTFFVNAKLLKSEKTQVDERIRALQDGRSRFIVFTSLYSLAVTEALLYSAGVENERLYIGLPLLVTPGSFFLALRGTDSAIMNRGRSFMISSSILWGSAMGFTSGMIFMGDRADSSDSDAYWRPFVFASAAGGLAYGTAAVLLTRGDAFPSKRVWFMNLGSFMGALIGIGVPYMFNVENRPVLLTCMFTGSTAGGVLAAWMTRNIVAQGANVENVGLGSLLEIGPEGVRPGIPLPEPVAWEGGTRPGYSLSLVRWSR